MTNIEFIRAGQKITGFTEKCGYQPAFAIRLGVGIDSIKGWSCGRNPIPRPIELFIKELLKNN